MFGVRSCGLLVAWWLGGVVVWKLVVSGHSVVLVVFRIIQIINGGFVNLLVPLILGAPDIAFLRITNISFLLLLPSLTLLIARLLV